MYHLAAIKRPGFLKDSGLKKQYAGKRVLVLGGDGFLGVHVATALQILGAETSILSRRKSSLLENIGITIHRGHLLQDEVLRRALAEKDVVFDLAGSSGAISSNRDPHRNFTFECEPHLNAFQLASEMPAPPLIVFCSSRTVYGKPRKLPVSESHPVSPISVYAIHKLALEQYLQNFHRTRGLNYLIFRLSNPYGPYLWQEKKDYGVINQFLLNAYFKQPISLFRDGTQRHDYIFIDDVVETFLRGSVCKACHNQVFNVGGPAPISIKEAVGVFLRQRPGSTVRAEDWPADYQVTETGDYVTDVRKLRSNLPDLQRTSFSTGVRCTFNAYDKLLAAGHEIWNSAVSPVPANVTRRATLPKRMDWNGTRVLVTGASGFIGRRLGAKLLEMGARVAALDRAPLLPLFAKHPRALLLQADLEEGEQALSELETFQPEVIFHLAARPDGPEVENHAAGCINVNLRGTVNLLEMACRRAVSAFVFADSAKAYGNSPVPHREDSPTDPCSSYAASKLAAWNYCRMFSRLHGLKVVALRSTMIYGPGQGKNLFSFLAKCLAEGVQEIPLDGGMQTRDPVYIDDAVNAYLRLAESANRLSGRAIPISGGCERSVQDLAELFVRVAGYSAAIRCRKEEMRPTEMVRSYCDNLDAWEALRWCPEMSLNEGLRLTAEYLFRDQVRSSETLREVATSPLALIQGSPEPLRRRVQA